MSDTKETHQLVHYGKLLKLNMFEQKKTNKEVMDILGYLSYETLNRRFNRGDFSYDELRILKHNKLI